MSSTVKAAILWVVIIVLVVLLWSLFSTTKDNSEAISYSTFLARVEGGVVQAVVIRGTDVFGTTKPEAAFLQRQFHVTIPANYPYTYDLLRTHGVNIEIASTDTPLRTALISWAPILFLIGLWMYFIRIMKRNAAAKEAETVSPQGRNHSAE